MNSNDDEPQNHCCQICCSLLFGTLCIVFSTVPSLYGSKEECENLRIVTLCGGICFISLTIIIETVLYCYITTEQAKNVVNLIYGFTQLAIFITIWVFLAQDEDCGALRAFILVYTWIIVVLGGILFVAFLFVMCCKGSPQPVEADQENEQNQPII